MVEMIRATHANASTHGHHSQQAAASCRSHAAAHQLSPWRPRWALVVMETDSSMLWVLQRVRFPRAVFNSVRTVNIQTDSGLHLKSLIRYVVSRRFLGHMAVNTYAKKKTHTKKNVSIGHRVPKEQCVALRHHLTIKNDL